MEYFEETSVFEKQKETIVTVKQDLKFETYAYYFMSTKKCTSPNGIQCNAFGIFVSKMGVRRKVKMNEKALKSKMNSSNKRK